LKQAVIKVKAEDLKQVEKLILESKHAFSDITKGEYEAFRILFAGESVIAYTSGKIVSGGPRAQAIVQTAVQSLAPNSTESGLVIGSDEAGKGEWLGPMVVAAVALTPTQSRMLQSLGIMDSKEIPIGRLSELAAEIESRCESRTVLLVSPLTTQRRR